MSSVWEETVKLPEFPALRRNLKTDVLIVGGGLAGILIAHELELAGVNYLLIESKTICNGVTGKTTAKITSQHGLIYEKLLRKFGTEYAKAYWEVNETALERYRDLCRTISCDFEEQDSYIYSTNSLEVLDREFAALQRLKIPVEFAKQLPLPFPTKGAVKFAHQAQFHPLKFVAEIAKNLNIREHTAAQEFAGNLVRTNGGTIKAENIIITTHFPVINKHGSYFLKMYQDRSHVIALAHAPVLHGMYLDEAQDGFSFRNYKDLLLLGGESHRTGKKSAGWEPLHTAAKDYFPSAQEMFRWATQDCMTLDGVPYIGAYSKKTHNLYTATGFNKWGMTSSMVAAMLLCDMVQGRKNRFAAVFSPSRTMLRTQLLTNALEATLNLATPTKPRCPHMGCALKWNRRERSWDCPCHGSRFAKDGTLLNNPATDGLNDHKRE